MNQSVASRCIERTTARVLVVGGGGGGRAYVVDGVDLGALLKQILDQHQGAVLDSSVKRILSDGVLCDDRRTLGQEYLGTIEPTRTTSDMQRRIESLSSERERECVSERESKIRSHHRGTRTATYRWLGFIG